VRVILRCLVASAVVFGPSAGVWVRSPVPLIPIPVYANTILIGQSGLDPTLSLGTMFMSMELSMDQLRIDLSIGHHNENCTSSVATCSTTVPGFGKDDLWPLWTPVPPGRPNVTWHDKQTYDLAVNGTYFYKCSAPGVTYDNADCVSTAGPIIAGGRVIIPQSQNREPNGPLDVLRFHSDRSASMIEAALFPATSPQGIVTAIGGNILMANGVYADSCDSNCHEALTAQPRTVIAFDNMTSSGHITFLVVQPGRNAPFPGATARQTAAYLKLHDFQYAFMLDGGGSSSFVYRGKGQPTVSIPGDVVVNGSQQTPVYRPVTTIIGIRGRR
jgi:hypothetical protein